MILALELSTRRGSIALLDGNTVRAERTWDDPAARHLALWSNFTQLLREHPVTWPKLDAVAVGRGPGSFSGLRAGIVAARMFAAPDAIPVLAISSGEALARAWFTHHPSAGHPLVIAGDARRGAIWMGAFERNGEDIRPSGDWRLLPIGAVNDGFPIDARVLTSDRTRLLAACPALGEKLVEEPPEAFPSAVFVGHAAANRLARRLPHEPIEPLYLHPPV